MKICVQCSAEILSKNWQCSVCGYCPDIRNGFPVLAPEFTDGGAFYPVDAHDRLIKIEQGNFWFVSRNKLLQNLFIRYFPVVNNLKMIEIGCGTGFVLAGLAERFPSMTLFGADPYLSGLQYAKKRVPEAEFIQMDAGISPFLEEFDVVGIFDVLEHIEDDRKVLQEIRKSLKPGGGLLITVPQHPWLWSSNDVRAGHRRRYTRKELTTKLKEAGFRIEKINSFVSLLLPFMIAGRFKAIIFPKRNTENIQVGLRLPHYVNSIFKLICSLEGYLFNLGMPFRVGGSLVCVAFKSEESNGQTG